MGCVTYSSRLGMHCGSKCTIFTLILGLIYLLGCIAYSLTMRLFVKGYYTSAYVAGLSFFVALFVISHHIFKIQINLGCPTKCFYIYQSIINVFYMLCLFVMSGGYIALNIMSINMNFDLIAAAVFGLFDLILVIYLICLTVAASNGERFQNYTFQQINDGYPRSKENAGIVTYYQEMQMFQDSSSNGHLSKNGGSQSHLVDSKSKKSGCNCKRCCFRCWNVLFGIFYFIAQLLCVVIFALSACYTVFTATDLYFYRNVDDMYTVQVEGHRPLSLYMKCRGNGSETIIYENGLGSPALAAYDFIPKYLEKDYTVCVHDRRGYGWSESFENDYMQFLIDKNETQMAETNTDFFMQLVKEAKIQTPFYYMGHSYGGHHITFTAIRYPEVVKGLIYLDSARFNFEDQLEDYLEVVSNFQGTGLLYVGLKSKIVDPDVAFGSIMDINDVDDEVRDTLFAMMQSGSYFTAYKRELDPLRDEQAFDVLQQQLTGEIINKPLLVIDAGDRGDPAWFPGIHFTEYSVDKFHVSIPGSTHSSITLTTADGRKTARMIDAWVKLLEGNISEDDYMVVRNQTVDGLDV